MNAGKNYEVTSAPRLLIEVNAHWLFLSPPPTTIIRLLAELQFLFTEANSLIKVEKKRMSFLQAYVVH